MRRPIGVGLAAIALSLIGYALAVLIGVPQWAGVLIAFGVFGVVAIPRAVRGVRPAARTVPMADRLPGLVMILAMVALLIGSLHHGSGAATWAKITSGALLACVGAYLAARTIARRR